MTKPISSYAACMKRFCSSSIKFAESLLSSSGQFELPLCQQRNRDSETVKCGEERRQVSYAGSLMEYS